MVAPSRVPPAILARSGRAPATRSRFSSTAKRAVKRLAIVDAAHPCDNRHAAAAVERRWLLGRWRRARIRCRWPSSAMRVLRPSFTLEPGSIGARRVGPGGTTTIAGPASRRARRTSSSSARSLRLPSGSPTRTARTSDWTSGARGMRADKPVTTRRSRRRSSPAPPGPGRGSSRPTSADARTSASA